MATPRGEIPDEVSPVESKAISEIQVVIVGSPGTGKSTALNNIFKLDFKADLSANSVTTRVLKKTQIIGERGLIVNAIDIPGFSAPDVNEKTVLRDMKDHCITKRFLLLVTYPVYGQRGMTEGFSNILKNITSIFGVEVWNWSIFLFTHSDTLSIMDALKENGHQKTQDHLVDSCVVLQKELKKVGVNKKIKPFMEYSSQDAIKQKSSDTIIAVPISRDTEISMTSRLLPDQPWAHKYSWTDLVFMEIVNVKDNIPQASYIRSFWIRWRYGKRTFRETASGIDSAVVVPAVITTVGAAIGLMSMLLRR